LHSSLRAEFTGQALVLQPRGNLSGVEAPNFTEPVASAAGRAVGRPLANDAFDKAPGENCP
jgi:hypothetical protein